MKQFQGSLGPIPGFVNERRPASQNPHLNDWTDSNSKLRAINSPVTTQEWRRIGRDLLPYVLIWAAFAAYIVWAWWPK